MALIANKIVQVTQSIISGGGSSSSSAESQTELLNRILNMTAEAYTVPPTSEATVTWNANTGKMTFGIPKGETGDITAEQVELLNSTVAAKEASALSSTASAASATEAKTAQTGAESAKSSALTASASATSAASSASSSATAAATSETNAAMSEANALSYKEAAESAKTAAEAAEDVVLSAEVAQITEQVWEDEIELATSIDLANHNSATTAHANLQVTASGTTTTKTLADWCADIVSLLSKVSS